MTLGRRDTGDAGAARDATHPDFVTDLDGGRAEDEVFIRRISEELGRVARLGVDLCDARQDVVAGALSDAPTDTASFRCTVTGSEEAAVGCPVDVVDEEADVRDRLLAHWCLPTGQPDD